MLCGPNDRNVYQINMETHWENFKRKSVPKKWSRKSSENGILKSRVKTDSELKQYIYTQKSGTATQQNKIKKSPVIKGLG